MEKYCIILHQVDIKNEITDEEFHLQADIFSKKLKKMKLPELGINQGYLFMCKRNIFVLYVGHLIPFTGWAERLKSTIEKSFNENCNTAEKISLVDHTYNKNNKTGNSRRLRSIGGALRRIVEISQRDLKSLTKKEVTTKEIFRCLEPFRIIINKNKIDEKQLLAYLFAVQYNKKLVLK